MNRKISKMEKKEVRQNLYLYYFIEGDGETVNSIYAFIDPSGETPKALILDTAFPAHMEMVRKDLESNGIKPEIIVLSHYHPDHAGGCSVISSCRVYANVNYDENFENCKRWNPEVKFFRPSDILKNNDTLSFGSFVFKFVESPGHSRCSHMTIINDEVIHAGDLLMFDVNGKLNIPYISPGGNYRQFMDSLQKLKSMNFKSILLPHGGNIDDTEKVMDAIDDSVHYLRMVLNSNGALPLASCLKKPVSAYTNTKFHDNNLYQFMMLE